MKITVEFESKGDEGDFIFEFALKSTLNLMFPLRHKIINIIPSGVITFDSIEKSVCDLVDCTPDELQHHTRKRKVVEARQICHYLARNSQLGTLAEIGFRYGKKDHATVLYSNRTVLNLLQTDCEYQFKYKSFIQSFDHERQTNGT